MQLQTLRLRAFICIAGVSLLVFSGWANADPPARVARLGYASGAVSFSPAGDNQWVQASINRPLTNGDRLWTDQGARAEIQVGDAMVRMSDGSSVSVLNFDDRIAQLQLTQGTLNVRVRRLAPNQVFEVDTPNLAFTLRQPGEYRIAVDPNGNATDIIVRRGQGEAYGEGTSYVIDSRQPYRFTGTGLRDYQYLDAPRLDEFDRWAIDRDHRYDNSASARYVSRDMVGYQDLDESGTWRANATYGNVWVPNRVGADWAPYRDGHWAWVNPWGWTWVDDAPWGFAVSHYGRWTNMSGTWGWVPGPLSAPAYYAPALVVFVGGSNFQLTIFSGNVGGVAWFPLAPREVYQPFYASSRSYFENINRSNTVINNTVIKNTYNTTNVTNIIYANRQVPGAIIAVPRTAFVQSQQVSRAAVQVSPKMIASATIAVIAPAAPTERSVLGAASPGDRPPARVFERSVVAHTAPPAAHPVYVAQTAPLSAKPGMPRGDVIRQPWKPAAAAPVPSVKVLAPAQIAVPTTPPPPAAPVSKSGDARVTADGKNAPHGPAVSVAPPAQSKVAGQPQASQWHATQPPPAALPAAPPGAAPRGKWEPRDNGEQRPRAVAPPPPPPQRAAEPKTTAPQVAPAAPATQAPSLWSTQSRVVPTAHVARPVPAAQPTVKPESAPTSRQAESRLSVASPKPPPLRPAESAHVAPPVAPWKPATPAPQQRSVPQITPTDAAAPPAQANWPAPAARPPAPAARPEPAAVARQAELRPPVAAPRPPPKTQPQVQNHNSMANKPADGKNDSEEEKRKHQGQLQPGVF